MASQTEICNRALQLLGSKRIGIITEDSKNARACSDAYDPVRLAMLRSHTWSCATTRAQVAASATAPTFGRARAFPLPADWLRSLPLYPEDQTNADDRLVEGDHIYSDESAPLNLRYVYDLEDPNKMDALFREAFAHKLAEAMCFALTNSNARLRELRIETRRVMAEARKANAVEQPAQKPPEDTWVTARL